MHIPDIYRQYILSYTVISEGYRKVGCYLAMIFTFLSCVLYTPLTTYTICLLVISSELVVNPTTTDKGARNNICSSQDT